MFRMVFLGLGFLVLWKASAEVSHMSECRWELRRVTLAFNSYHPLYHISKWAPTGEQPGNPSSWVSGFPEAQHSCCSFFFFLSHTHPPPSSSSSFSSSPSSFCKARSSPVLLVQQVRRLTCIQEEKNRAYFLKGEMEYKWPFSGTKCDIPSLFIYSYKL